MHTLDKVFGCALELKLLLEYDFSKTEMLYIEMKDPFKTYIIAKTVPV